MATKRGKLVTCHEGLLPIMLLHHLVTWSWEITRETKTIVSALHDTYGYKTWQDGDLPLLHFAHKVKWTYNHVVLWDHMTNQKHMSTTTMHKATKHGRMMAYLEWFLPIKSHDCIIMWSCKITWQTNIIYPLTHFLWLSILTGWGNTMRSFLA